MFLLLLGFADTRREERRDEKQTRDVVWENKRVNGNCVFISMKETEKIRAVWGKVRKLQKSWSELVR